MYIAYILLLVPGWMRDISVVSDAGKCGSFLITQNLATGSIALIGYWLAGLLSRPIQAAARRCAGVRAAIPGRAFPVVRAGLVGLMLCACIALTLLL
ncbi:MAG: hypothetical protein GX549_04370 [Clostridiales bacterium]|nr:hypothetical protein [Clostridiales bacterium]